MKRVLVMMLAVAFLCGCASVGSHPKSAQSGAGDRIAAEKVQGEIRIGMTSAQVAQILGSPTVETADKNGLKVWVYDKISAVSYSRNVSGAWLLRARVPESTEARSASQGMLNVVVKFDADKRIRDICTHSHRVKEMGDEEK